MTSTMTTAFNLMIGILEPAPSMDISWREFEGSLTDAKKLADTFCEIEGRPVVVAEFGKSVYKVYP